MTKQFRESLLAVLVHAIFIYPFFFDASTKKLFESFHYHVLFGFCLAAVAAQVNTANNIQYL